MSLSLCVWVYIPVYMSLSLYPHLYVPVSMFLSLSPYRLSALARAVLHLRHLLLRALERLALSAARALNISWTILVHLLQCRVRSR